MLEGHITSPEGLYLPPRAFRTPPMVIGPLKIFLWRPHDVGRVFVQALANKLTARTK